jgi:general secretion pathway protein L
MAVFLNWWLTQLSELFPVLWRRTARAVDAVILDISGDPYALAIRAKGKTRVLAQASADNAGLDELAGALQAEKDVPRLQLLRLKPGDVLHKRLTFPLTARRDLDRLLGFEVERETPFGRDEIHWTYRTGREDPAQGSIDVELFIVPQVAIAPVLEAARRSGFRPEAVEADGDSRTTAIPLSTENVAARRRSYVPLAAAAVLLLAALIGPLVYELLGIRSAEAEIAALSPQAQEAATLRQSADTLARTTDFFRRDNRRYGSMLSTVAAVTRALPDDSYLIGLTLRGERLTLTGHSPSAAQLIGVFAHSPLFREPAFDTPVVKAEDSDLENFTISVSVAQRAQP